MKDFERDTLRKCILDLVRRGVVHYTEIEKRSVATCQAFITSNSFKPQFRYLLENGFIERVSRGVYALTDRGKSYLAIFTR